MAEAERVLSLFDSYWYEHEIFTNKPPSPPPATTNPVHIHQIHEEEQQQHEEEPKLSRALTIHVRSHSDQLLCSNTSFISDSQSPKSVLHTPRLEPILSGKEVFEFAEPAAKQEETEIPMKKKVSRMRRRRKRGNSKSLSDLEFEEVKGFMDLGFVFSEEDKDSRLVSIIPGLQRLGRKGVEDDDEKGKEVDESVVSRPYLSEAWDVLDRKEVEQPLLLMDWRIPASGNKMDMKDNLRFWAHTVASTVR